MEGTNSVFLVIVKRSEAVDSFLKEERNSYCVQGLKVCKKNCASP